MTAVLTEPVLAPPVLRPLAFRVVPAPTSAPPYDDERVEPPVLRLVPPLALVSPPPPVPFDDAAWLASERTPTAELPAAEDFARTLVQALLEVLAGVRPISQLRRDTTPELYLRLRTLVRCRPWTSGPRPDRRAVRSVHVQQRPEGVAEACATVRRGVRLAALALRMEGVDGRWQCTDLVGV